MKNFTQSLNRRAVLRGAGATLALPFLESFAWAANGKKQLAPSDSAPLRYGCFLFANGVNPFEWDASGTGDAMSLSSTLQPLAPHKQDITILKGLHVFNNTSGPHWPLFSNYLNGIQFSPSLAPQGGISLDQLIARHTGRQTSVPSLVLGVEPAESGVRGGVPSIYYGTVSWSSSTTPIPPEIYPRAVYDRLFDTSSLLRDRSVLDAILDRSKDLHRQLGRVDQQKMDEFMTSVRELEERIGRATSEERLEGWRPSLANPDMARPAENAPQDVADHMRMMLDLVLLAWQMDKTRVATLIFNRDVSHMKFGFLDGVLNDQLHGISHHKGKKERLASYQRINQFHVEQLAYLMKKMAAIDEGNGTTLLDNVMMQFGSNMFNGDSHDGRDLPMILAGHGGGALSGGRVIDYSKEPEERQRACNLYLVLAQTMGLEIDRFGDSAGPIEGLTTV
ncbi:MAG: DUF1552 domain-containing protein [Verrucomicrobiota bacterium]